MQKSLKPYIDIEAERLTNTIVNKAIKDKIKENNNSSFYTIKDGKITYDFFKINQMKFEITEYVQNILSKLDRGEIENELQYKNNRFNHIRKGILAENTINSIKGSTLFGNVGPTIPIRLNFLGQINSNVDIKTKEYGINNMIVTIYLIMTIYEQISTPLSSSKKEITIKEVLSVDMIKGDIPNYYNGFSNKTNP